MVYKIPAHKNKSALKKSMIKEIEIGLKYIGLMQHATNIKS
jgi:hypothetical protein